MKNFYHFRSHYVRRKSSNGRPSFRLCSAPTYQQNQQLKVLLELVEANRLKPKAVLIDLLTKLGYPASDMRIYKSGGVGSYRWMPKYSKYRLQVAASHISNCGPYMPYALCIQF